MKIDVQKVPRELKPRPRVARVGAAKGRHPPTTHCYMQYYLRPRLSLGRYLMLLENIKTCEHRSDEDDDNKYSDTRSNHTFLDWKQIVRVQVYISSDLKITTDHHTEKVGKKRKKNDDPKKTNCFRCCCGCRCCCCTDDIHSLASRNNRFTR